MMLRTSLLTLFSLALAAQDPKPALPAQAPQAPKAEAKAEAPKANKVLGRIGGRIFRDSDLEGFLPLVLQPAQLEQLKQTPAMREQMVQKYMETMLLAEKARKDGVDRTPAFRTKMAAVLDQLLVQELVARDSGELQKKATPTDGEVKAYYEKNKNSFKTPETASARHILIPIKQGEKGEGLTEAEAKTKALQVKEELAKGKTWDVAAKEHSTDPGSKDKGGLYEDFNPDQMVGEFAKAVREQEIGKVGDPVKTQFGYHLIQVEKRKPSELRPFEAARDEARQQLTRQNQDSTWKAYVEQLKKDLGYAEGAKAAEAPQGTKAQSKAPAKKTAGGKK